MRVLDLFSAAAGGWSLGMHRAGYRTVAACENVEWRRILYGQNNPGVTIYDDVRTLTAARLVSDLGFLPDIVVGSPPCQDISSANAKGKGVEGERSGLFFEAVRIIGEVRPRWFALENSANLRTRGADAVISALEGIGYACWPLVVRAGDVGANHERPRCWLIGCDTAQVIDAAGVGYEGGRPWGHGSDGHGASYPRDAAQDGCRQGFPWGRGEPASRPQFEACGDGANPVEIGSQGQLGRDERRQGEVAQHADVPAGREMGLCPDDRGSADGPWPLWSLDDLAGRLRLDDGLPARVAGTRVAVGGPRGTAAASLIVEAYGDAVVPQIPEAIGRAILRVETALAAIHHRSIAA